MESDYKQNSKGSGMIVKARLEVLSGPYQGRNLFANFNVLHQNPQAQSIGQAQFSELCHALGEMTVNDTEILHFRPMIAIVKVKPGDAQHAARNEIKGYKPFNGGATAPQTGGPAQPNSGQPRPAMTQNASNSQGNPAGNAAAPVQQAAMAASGGPPWQQNRS